MIMTHLKLCLYADKYFQNFHLQSLLHLAVHAAPGGIKKIYRLKTKCCYTLLCRLQFILQASVEYIFIKKKKAKKCAPFLQIPYLFSSERHKICNMLPLQSCCTFQHKCYNCRGKPTASLELLYTCFRNTGNRTKQPGKVKSP